MKIPGKRKMALWGWPGWAWLKRESRREDDPTRSFRPTTISQFLRHFPRTGTVANLWRCSWGCCRITIWDTVEIGCGGSLSQRHTFSGLSQRPVHVRRRPSRPSMVADAGSSGRSCRSSSISWTSFLVGSLPRFLFLRLALLLESLLENTRITFFFQPLNSKPKSVPRVQSSYL